MTHGGPATRAAARFIAAGAVAMAIAGCSGGAPPEDQAGLFVAFGKDFVGFRDWPSQSYENPEALALPDAAATHLAGRRTVYVNQLPPAGATEFPIGTIIVKEIESVGTGGTSGKIFARAKRGGGYNRSGARNWEWFEISEAKDNQIAVVWHGVGPPKGEEYAGDANGGCNGCHSAAVGNDYVLSPFPVLEPTGSTENDGGVDGGGAGDDGSPTDAALD
jgi:hypothetical protein